MFTSIVYHTQEPEVSIPFCEDNVHVALMVISVPWSISSLSPPWIRLSLVTTDVTFMAGGKGSNVIHDTEGRG